MELEGWLNAGISALKAGNRLEARTWLMRVVEIDEENEQAWLWLSGTMDSHEDKRICLENVLTLNPNNLAAQKGLTKLPPTTTPVTSTPFISSPSPEREPLTTPFFVPHDPVFEDVWADEREICAFCAAEVTDKNRRCPKCRHNLIVKQYRYPNASSNLYIFFSIVLGLGQLFIIQGIYEFVFQHQLVPALASSIAGILFIILALFIYFRQAWAHLFSLYLFAILLIYFLLQLLIPDEVAIETLPPDLIRILKPDMQTIGITIGKILRGFEASAVAFAFLFATLFVGADFQRDEGKLIARLRSGLRSADQFHLAAKELSRVGLWASATLHWQRATALDPKKFVYQRELAHAYAKLGFWERSLDIVHSAQAIASKPEQRAELEKIATRNQRIK